MALQIRRGTDAERLLIIPLQGELIFTTDTKKLYVGDGTTLGGVAVDNLGLGGAATLDELTDVVITGATNGQVLKFNGTNWVNGTDNTGGSSITSLDDIPGVILTGPTNGQVLKFDGTNWTNSNDLNDGTGSIALDDITDVVVTGATTGQVLKFNGTNWVNDTDDTGTTISSINDINDVVISGAVNGEVLKFDGTNWVNNSNNISDLNDVSIGTPVSGDVLSYNGTVWTRSTPVTSLNGLSDVGIATPVSGQFLQFNGTVWTGLDLTTYGGDISSGKSQIKRNSDSLNGEVLFLRSRGSVGAETQIINNDIIGAVNAFGYNGSSYAFGGAIRFHAASSSLGTGLPTSLRFVLNNSSNINRTMLDANGEINRVTISSPLYLTSETGGAFSQFLISQAHALADSAKITFQRSRGSLTGPTSVQNGDDIQDFSFLAHDGVSYNLAASISVMVDGVPSAGAVPGKMVFRTRNSSGVSAERLTINGAGNVVVRTSLLLDNSLGFGYTTGAGGSVTQLTNKSTGVTLNTATGEITLNAEALSADTSVSFTLTNSIIVATDHVIASHVSGGTLGAYGVTASAGAGSCNITLRNLTSSPLSEAVVIKYTVIRSSIT